MITNVKLKISPIPIFTKISELGKYQYLAFVPIFGMAAPQLWSYLTLVLFTDILTFEPKNDSF